MTEQRRVVRGSFRSERPQLTTEAVPQEGLVSGLLSFLWEITERYCTELMLLAFPLLPWGFLQHQYSALIATVIVVPLVVLFLVLPWTRHVVTRSLRHARIRRRFETACRFAFLVTHNSHTPEIVKITTTPSGERLRVRIRSGLTPTDIENAAERLAVALDVRDVQVERDETSARYVFVSVVRKDPFSDHTPIPWPGLQKPSFSMWDGIPLAVDELGRTINVAMPEQNLLIGGLPGGGKSVALSLFCAAAALDPQCKLTVIDGKDVELVAWHGIADDFSGSDVADANVVLTQLHNEMSIRYEWLRNNQKRKIERTDAMPLHVVVIDELASFLLIGGKDDIKTFSKLLQDLVSKGRAAGIIVVAATQKPASEIVPTGLRDLFSLRWAFRCSTPQQSDTILGQGWATQDYSASELGSSPPKGLGFLLHESGTPTRCRSFHLSDENLRSVATQAKELRGSTPKALKVVA